MKHWCSGLALRVILRLPELRGLHAIQCTLFAKSAARNWLVAPHQDLSVPLPTKTLRDQGRLTSDGLHIARADATLLASCVAVRVHLDDCGANDGALRTVPGSHRRGILTQDEISESVRAMKTDLQIADAGDAWLMSPLLIHASSKASGSSRRRVLHFLFAPLFP